MGSATDSEQHVAVQEGDVVAAEHVDGAVALVAVPGVAVVDDRGAAAALLRTGAGGHDFASGEELDVLLFELRKCHSHGLVPFWLVSAPPASGTSLPNVGEACFHDRPIRP